MLKSGEVFAFFDVREEGEFSTKGHPLFATPLPLSRLEPRALALLPDPNTRIVLMDSGEEGHDPQWAGRANRAAAQAPQLGYTDLAVMKGGLKALARRGLRGVHRRQRAQQGVRRGGRARERHAAHRRRRPAEADRRQDRPGDPRFAADAGIQQHVDPGRHRLPRRRAGLSGQGPGAQPQTRWWW